MVGFTHPPADTDLGLGARFGAKAVNSAGFRYRRASRLLKPAAFQAVFDVRNACRGRWLTVHRLQVKVPDLPEPTEDACLVQSESPVRLGLIVAKRLVPTAARRNLIRRILREYFRTTPTAFPPGDWIIRLHTSPFLGRSKNEMPPTRRQIVGNLRSDLSGVLGRITAQNRKADQHG